MAKGKKGKKGKKKKDKTEEAHDEQDVVEKEMLQILVEDLQQEVNYLQKQCEQLEASNFDFSERYHKLDEDRADIISYLNRIVQEKSDEIEELQERLLGLQKARQQESETYEKRILVLQHEAKVMQEQLTSEIKLLSGKLNSLEEFRIQRDELMNKFKRQEKQMEEQEKIHRNMLYEVERKFIIRRDRLKKEMETSLLELSTQFRSTTLKQIAANTQRTIRENIAINNELDLLLKHTFELSNTNEDLIQSEQQKRLQLEIVDFERKTSLHKSNKQSKALSKLKSEVQELKLHEAELHRTEDWARALEASMDAAEARLEGAAHVVRRLRTEVRLRDAKIKMQTRLAQHEQSKCKKIENILRNAVMAVRMTLGVCAEESPAYPFYNQQLAKQDPEFMVNGDPNDPVWRLTQRENLLNHLLKLLQTAEEISAEADREEQLLDTSLESIGYKPGDLGLMKKDHPAQIDDLLSSPYTEDE